MAEYKGMIGFKKTYCTPPSANSDGKADLKKMVNLSKKANHQSTK